MNGASRDALAAARERLDALTDNTSVNPTVLADELAAVTALLHREPSLRRALTDPAQPGESKAALAQRLLGSQLGGDSVDLVSGMVRARWSQSRDLVDALEELANTADLTAAQKRGRLDNVEDELFRFGRILDGQPRLRRLLADPLAPADRRAELLDSLISGKVSQVTARLLGAAVRMPRGRSLDAVAEGLAELAAARRDRYVAHVTAPTPLDAEQEERLASALSRVYGRGISLQVEVDPDLLGGLVVRVGEEVIDGSVSNRLDRARQRLAGS